MVDKKISTEALDKGTKNLDSAVLDAKPLMTRNDAPHVPKRRPARVSMTNKGNLSFPAIPGYHTRVVTVDDPDQPIRHQKFQDAWWEPVTRGEMYGSDVANAQEYVRAPVGKKNGHVTHGIVMKLPNDLRTEDDKAKEAAREAKVRARGNDGEQGTSLKLDYGS